MNIHSCAKMTSSMQIHLTPLPPAATAPKTEEILRAVRIAFVDKGFDGASMQDLARAAGMSVGNFYRYFPSKDAIISQMIALDMAEIEAVFAQVLNSPRPMDSLRAVIAQRLAQDKSEKTGQLWAEIAAAAQRKPEIAANAADMEITVAGYLTQVFAAETGLPPDAANARFAAEAGFIILLIRSAATMTPCHPYAPDCAAIPDLTPLIMRTINQVLDSVSGAGSKG
ncbi:MAG: TetR/AcrR family transcriptional regulator [Cypionkella sp.]|nr:TetR/AcrR family transcriptional regulator [Cypionkella sp.]